MKNARLPLFDRAIVLTACGDALKKLQPQAQWKNPVMFVVYLGSILTTLLWFQSLGGQGEAPSGFILSITLWLWFTVLFANFAEALAEGRSRAQAASLRGMKRQTLAKLLQQPKHGAAWLPTEATLLRKDQVVLIEAGDWCRWTAS